MTKSSLAATEIQGSSEHIEVVLSWVSLNTDPVHWMGHSGIVKEMWIPAPFNLRVTVFPHELETESASSARWHPKLPELEHRLVPRMFVERIHRLHEQYLERQALQVTLSELGVGNKLTREQVEKIDGTNN